MQTRPRVATCVGCPRNMQADKQGSRHAWPGAAHVETHSPKQPQSAQRQQDDPHAPNAVKVVGGGVGGQDSLHAGDKASSPAGRGMSLATPRPAHNTPNHSQHPRPEVRGQHSDSATDRPARDKKTTAQKPTKTPGWGERAAAWPGAAPGCAGAGPRGCTSRGSPGRLRRASDARPGRSGRRRHLHRAGASLVSWPLGSRGPSPGARRRRQQPTKPLANRTSGQTCLLHCPCACSSSRAGGAGGPW